jgi:acyl-CoA thioesterase I
MENIVLIGDSVTDCDRLIYPPYGLGYVSKLAKLIDEDFKIINVGTSGDRLINLEQRWDKDVMENHPDILSIAIGINDTWRRYDSGQETSAEDFEKRYRALLSQTEEKLPIKFVLCEPFLLHVESEMENWREDLNPKISIVHNLAKEFNAKLVSFDQMFNQAALTTPIETLAPDGIHPTELGHEMMANLWFKEVFSENS